MHFKDTEKPKATLIRRLRMQKNYHIVSHDLSSKHFIHNFREVTSPLSWQYWYFILDFTKFGIRTTSYGMTRGFDIRIFSWLLVNWIGFGCLTYSVDYRSISHHYPLEARYCPSTLRVTLRFVCLVLKSFNKRLFLLLTLTTSRL